MATLVFDIETVGESWEDIDDVTQAVLTRWVHQIARTPEETERLLADVVSGLGFSPFTGEIVSIAVYDSERRLGAVYYQGDPEPDSESADWRYKVRDEQALLAEFWQGAALYDTFVTFNGRAFDAPFLVHRSLVHGVQPTKDLLEGRYPHQQKQCRHIDLQDELTFYGALQRRPSLHLLCRAYGIESPKQGVSGDDVAELFRQKKFRDIAEYNRLDVIATTELYERWHQYRHGLYPTPEIDF